jgi:hypothetical protein
LATYASAQTDGKGSSPERGWFFFEDPPVKEEPKPPEPAKAVAPPQSRDEQQKEDPCKNKESWKPECGFVDPGTDFAFQEKIRDGLMQRMSLSKNDPKAVEAFQYYMKWVIERTAEVTNLWWYNMVQNPELDPSVQSPVSALGLKLMSEVKSNQGKDIFALIKDEGGFFVYFSRHDCKFCHAMTDVLRLLEQDTGLKVRNAALDDKCMPYLEEGCVKHPATYEPAVALQVTVVPALFLYVPKNTWIRVATGATTLDVIKERTVQFFAAYRSALLNGTENSDGVRPSVDFSGTAATGLGKGVEKREPRLPSAEEIKRLLGS